MDLLELDLDNPVVQVECMDATQVFQDFGPSVGHLVFTQNGERVSSGSGFMVGGVFVTCAHVIDAALKLPLKIKFPNAVGAQSKEWGLPNGIQSLEFLGYSSEHNYDFAVIQPPDGILVGPSLEFASQEPQVGIEVCGLGFPFEQEELTITRGIVSSISKSGVARMLKLDMSINPSNSGGPLIALDSGKVVGVIARKATGLTRAFDQLMESFDNNIKVLDGRDGVTLMGVDPIKVLQVTQNQMKAVSQQIRRSAHVGIGWAVFIEPLRSEGAFSSS